MSRQYSPYSTTRDGYTRTRNRPDRGSDHPADQVSDQEYEYDLDYPTDRQRRYGADDPVLGSEPDEYPDYRADYRADYQYPADYHDELDRRWIWVAGIAGVVLMVAVVCTGVILGGGDSGTITAATTTAAPADDSATTTEDDSMAAPPSPVADQPNAALAPETVITVTPEPTQPAPSATLAPVPGPEAPAPGVPAPPAVPGPALDPAVDPGLAARTVTYQVTGNRQLIDLITVIYTDQQGALQTDLNVALPWVKTITLDPGVTLSSVTATSVGGQLNCAILDGNGTALAVQANDTMIATCTR